MGEGKTVDRWDEWTAEMQERHGNGNGHGRSLAIEAMRLLPTPLKSDSNHRTKSDNWQGGDLCSTMHALAFLGASTSLPSEGGKLPLDDAPRLPLTTPDD
jgi:hypothetical protein